MVSEHANPLAAAGGVDSGGQHVHVAGLAAALATLGHEVTVYTRRTDKDDPGTAPMAPGVTVEHVPAGPPEPVPKDELLPYMPAFAAYLARRWQTERPDVAHAHYWMSGMATLTAAGELGVPVVQTFHALGAVERRWQGTADPSPPSRVAIEYDIGQRASAVIATCTDEFKELTALGVPVDRVTVVPCGVDLGLFRPDGPIMRHADQNGYIRILSIGRLVPSEGVDTIIEAMPHVPGAHLIIAGGEPGDDEALRLGRLATASGLDGRVRLIGGVDRAGVPALMRSAQVVVATPWYEPFGMVPLEAMACGVSVVASAVGGHLDTVAGCGVLVPPRRPRVLAEVLRDLLARPDTRTSLATAGMRRARSRYGWPLVAAQTESVYRGLVGDRLDRLATAEG
ncbi:glycosyltransferase [Sphaerisporangium sp. NPDC049002]|uniref:glycosyltransferase n=1 Tax=Sphaerisporangium sp. NPDC049002 TaxID=3155392 RepID=UPI0033E5DC6B